MLLSGCRACEPELEPPPDALHGIQRIWAAGYTSLALREDGTLLRWGSRQIDCTGSACSAHRPEPLAVDGMVVDAVLNTNQGCGVTQAGALWCWGWARCETVPGVEFQALEPVPVARPDRVVAAAITRFSACAFAADGQAQCWSSLSCLDEAAFERDLRAAPSKVMSQGVHVCVLLENGSVSCWFADNQSIAFEPPLPNAIDLSISDYRGAIVDVEGRVHEWRAGNSSYPNAKLRWTTWELEEAIAVDLGDDHACAVTRDGDVYCQGHNEAGQLGHDRSQETELARVPGVRDIVQVAVGKTHSCALRKDKTVLCWGSNGFDALGSTRAPPRLAPPTFVQHPAAQ